MPELFVPKGIPTVLTPSCRGHYHCAPAGMTLLELVIGMTILTVAIMISLNFITSSSSTVIFNQDRAFAIQKAFTMISELRAYAEAAESDQGAAVLDNFDDGIGTSEFLTIDETVTDAAHALSGNIWLSTRWRYARRITVRKFPSFQATNVRIVTVKIFLTQPGNPDETLLVDMSSVVSTLGDTAPTRQVYDIYLLCIENIPGWWVYLSYLKPFIENALADMESRCPGLEFRRHWITKAAYGRDQEYKPYFNNALDSEQDIDYVYFYPGTMPAGSAVNQYYVPGNVMARVNVDGVTINDYSALTNPHPYTLTDQYNHAMRYPDESELYQKRLAAGNETEGCLTYRLLLDDMVAQPQNYRNAIFINLHGELIPMPSIRNYSDAAKDPVGLCYGRAVTHPEKLRYGTGEDVKLRVYAYLSDPSVITDTYMTAPISIVIPDMDLTQAGEVTISAIKGGTEQHNDGKDPDLYEVVSPAPGIPDGISPTMYAKVNYDMAKDWTVLRLYNTPVCTPETTDKRGLNTTWRLYGMDYIPCPCEATNDFTRDLTDAVVGPKNTARWIITITKAALDAEGPDGVGPIAFETRLGNDLTTGVMWPVKNKPANLSRTYCGRTDNPNEIPFSERYQFQGDPRHCPYADVKGYHGYNWYFDNFRDSSANVIADWPGFDATRIRNTNGNNSDGWHGRASDTQDGRLEIDVPRFFLFIRTALTGAKAVYTSITGWSYYYMGLGNEIGYDTANGFTNSIPVSSKPFDGTSGSRNEQSITSAKIGAIYGGLKYIKENVASPYWWGKPWLGELYPDNVYSAQWAVNGNLNTGSGAGTFVRTLRKNISGSLPYGTTFYYTMERRTHQYGCTSFFNCGTSNSTFRHDSKGSTTGDLVTAGQEMSDGYNFILPSTADMSRPFRIDNDWGAVPNEFNISDYSSIRCNASVLSQFYDHEDGADWEGSSLIALENPAGSKGFIVVNGLDKTVETGTAFIARYSIVSLLHSLLTCGRDDLFPGGHTDPDRIVQLPRVEILNPNVTTELNDPDTIPLTWSITWTRWDEAKYTASYPDGFSETESDLRYALLYSNDNGATWWHIIDDSPATPGDPTLLIPDLNWPGGNENYTWNVWDKVKFPEGSYIIRIEAYRGSVPCHYAYHPQGIFINR